VSPSHPMNCRGWQGLADALFRRLHPADQTLRDRTKYAPHLSRKDSDIKLTVDRQLYTLFCAMAGIQEALRRYREDRFTDADVTRCTGLGRKLGNGQGGFFR
jgi:hypothetical protein